jgi:hypothetical protein
VAASELFVFITTIAMAATMAFLGRQAILERDEKAERLVRVRPAPRRRR